MNANYQQVKYEVQSSFLFFSPIFSSVESQHNKNTALAA